MATGVSGSMSTNASTYIVAEVDYSETYDIASNASSVTASLWYRRTNNWAGATVSPGTFYVNINGTNYSVYSGTFTIPGNDTSWHKVGEKTVTGIAHNSNGTKSITIGGSHSTTATNVAYMNFSMSETVALTTIPRNSSITVFNNFTIEDGLSFTYKDELASKTLTLTCKIGNTSILSKTYSSSVGTHTDSITFTEAQLNTIYGAVASNSKTAKFTLILATSGISSTSSKEATGTLKASANNPSVSGVTIEEIGNVASSGVADDQVMRYLSRKVLSASASAQHGATVASVRVVNDQLSANMTYNSTVGKYVSTAMSGLVTGTFVITVTDSRGFTASTTLTCTLLDYTYPTVTNVEFDRTSNIQDSGYVRATGTFWNKRVNDTTPAQVTLSVLMVITGGGTTVSYTKTYTGIPSTTSLSWNIEQLLPDATLLRDQTYTCALTITDQYGQTATYTVQLGLAKRALWLGKYTIKAEGIVGEHWVGLYKVGDIFLTMNTENPADRFGGTWELIAQGRALIGVGSIEANTVDTHGSVTAGGFTATANERGGTYSHSHGRGNLAAAIGAVDSDVYSIGYYSGNVVSGGPTETNRYAYGGLNVKSYGGGETYTFNHYTPVYGNTGATNEVTPYLAVYIWKKTA